MIEPILQHKAQWLDGTGPNADIVLSTHCQLIRNLADYPFPKQCKPDQLATIESNILTVLTNMNFLSTGEYYTLPEIDQTEAQYLLERKLISHSLINTKGTRGVYVSEDQSFSLSINDTNHLTLLSMASGQQLQDLWNTTSQTDDTLAGILDFAFDHHHGYLASHLSNTGIGLQFSATLHLPALTMTNELAKVLNELKASSENFAWDTVPQTGQDYCEICSAATPGQSEMEILYHFTQTIDQFIQKEQTARKAILNTNSLEIEDRVERALGLARNARLLAFDEGLGVLSSLRLGVSCGLLKGYTLATLNEIAIIAQDAHLQLNLGESCDDNNYNTQRAQLFREQFSENI